MIDSLFCCFQYFKLTRISTGFATVWLTYVSITAYTVGWFLYYAMIIFTFTLSTHLLYGTIALKFSTVPGTFLEYMHMITGHFEYGLKGSSYYQPGRLLLSRNSYMREAYGIEDASSFGSNPLMKYFPHTIPAPWLSILLSLFAFVSVTVLLNVQHAIMLRAYASVRADRDAEDELNSYVDQKRCKLELYRKERKLGHETEVPEFGIGKILFQLEILRKVYWKFAMSIIEFPLYEKVIAAIQNDYNAQTKGYLSHRELKDIMSQIQYSHFLDIFGLLTPKVILLPRLDKLVEEFMGLQGVFVGKRYKQLVAMHVKALGMAESAKK